MIELDEETVSVPAEFRRMLFEGCEMPETDEILDEGIKNKLLGWFGVKSNWTIVEDLVDMLADHKAGTPEYKKLKRELGDALMKQCYNSKIKNAIRNESRPSDEDLEKYVMQVVRENTDFKVTKEKDPSKFSRMCRIVTFALSEAIDREIMKVSAKAEKRREAAARERRHEIELEKAAAERKRKEDEEWERQRRREYYCNRKEDIGYSDFGYLDSRSQRIG